MQNWKNYLYKELGAIIVGLADGLLTDPHALAEKLRRVAYQIDSDKRKN